MFDSTGGGTFNNVPEGPNTTNNSQHHFNMEAIERKIERFSRQKATRNNQTTGG